MPLQKQVLIPFILGAGVVCLFAATLSAAIYNATHDLENTYTYLNIGIYKKIHIIAILIIVFGIITALLLLIAFFVTIAQASSCMKVLGTSCKIGAFVTFLVLLITQVIGLSKTRYGNYEVASNYNDYSDNDFKVYVDALYADENMGLKEILTKLNYSTPETFRVDYPEVFMNYMMQEGNAFKTYYVPVCDISSAKKLSINDTDTCNWEIEDANCIGDWKSSHFAGYICKQKLDQEDRAEKISDGGEIEGYKFDGAKQRYKFGVASFYSFYVMNSFFLGFEAFGYVLLAVTMIMKLILIKQGGEEKKEEPKKPEPKKEEQKKPEPKKEEEKKPEPKKEVSESTESSSSSSSSEEEEEEETESSSSGDEETTETISEEEEETKSSTSSSSEEEKNKDELSLSTSSSDESSSGSISISTSGSESSSSN